MTVLRSIQGAYDSVEEFCMAIDVLGWDSRFHQLDTQRGRSEFSATASGQAALMRISFNNRMHQRAVPPRGFRVFGLLTAPQAPGKIDSRPLEPDALIHMDPDRGLDAVIEPGFSGYTFAIAEERLQSLAELHELPDPTVRAAGPGTERFLDAVPLAQLRLALQAGLESAQNGLSPVQVSNALETELPSLILRSWYSASHSAQSGGNRTRVLVRALEYIEAFHRDPLTIEAVCLASACSISTLERAFKERFGVPPKRYLILRRLSGVRRALLSEVPGRSVTDIANEWGFWHMGKFAADYRRVYGELPSGTLSRASCHL